jgi:predicted nucleotidyltransferase
MATASYPSVAARREILEQVVQRVLNVAQPRRVLLFGSSARAQAGRDSDLDLLVILRGPVHRRRLAQEIYCNLHGIPLPVDIVVATEEDVELYGDQLGTISGPALLEGRVIYEARDSA